MRKTRGFPTQKALADAIGVDQATISRAENLHPSLTLGVYQRIANELGVTLSELFGDSRAAQEEALVRAFRILPQAQRDKWAELLRIAAGDAPAER